MGRTLVRELLLALANFAWSTLIVAPLVVLFWRGTWDMLNQLIYPDFPAEDAPSNTSRREKSGLVSFVLGVSIRIIFDLIRFHVGEFLSTKHSFLKNVGGLIYCLIYAMAGVAFWRGTWYLMKLDVGEKDFQLSIVLIGGVTVLVFSKISRTLISSPLGLCSDNHDNTFQISTYFQKLPSDKLWFCADVLFTNLVVRLLIVFCWWSLWSLEESVLNRSRIGVRDSEAAYDSLLIGYAAAILAVALDKTLQRSPAMKQYITRVLQCATTLVAFFSSVNVWRGIWSCYDNYLFPNISKEVNYVVSASFGFTTLAALRLSNTISNDHIIFDVLDSRIVDYDYFGQQKSESSDEMIPILD